MSYPQPEGADAVINSKDFWRLNTLLTSAGDMYELDVSSKALVLGPDSDIAQVRVNYYDEQVPTNRVNESVISPDRSLVGLVSAFVDRSYPTSGGKKGRILLSLKDIWDPLYIPRGVIGDVRIQRYVPRLDVMAYFSDPPTIATQRSDKLWNWEYVQAPLVAATASYIVLPYYGRKFASYCISNFGAVDITVTIFGVNYGTDNTPAGTTQTTQQKQLATGALTAGTGQLAGVIKASEFGMWDALLLSYTPASGSTIGPIPTRIITSDDPL